MRLALNYRQVDPTRGGAETYVVDLCRRLIESGQRVDLYAESWAEGVLPPEVGCVPVESTGRTKLGRIKSFARNSAAALETADHDCTVGLINTYHHDVIIPQGGIHPGSLDANSKRFPTVWQRSLYKLGKTSNPKHWTYLGIERKQYHPERRSHVVAVSRMVKAHIEQHYHVPKARIHVVPNAIDTARLEVAQPGAVRCAFRNKFGIEPRDLVGLFVGHNFELKGLRPLLRALADRKHADPAARPIHLLVCGGGKLGPFRRLAASLGLSDSVHMLGYYPEIRDCFWSSDFFVLPTYYDPCSLVVFEALACGLPVITTACNGAAELMTDGQEGFVITAPDARGELILALDRVTDDQARRTMSERAVRLGREQSLDRHVARLVKVFEEVAAGKTRHSPHSAKFPSKRAFRGL